MLLKKINYLLLLLAPSAFIMGCEKKVSKRPNILVIVADDLGYSDLGCYGSEIETPNIDRLAKNGVQFTQFYNSARCCPTRASILTGLYPHQAGIGSFVGPDKGVPGYRGRLTSNTVTIAEVLKNSGYQTFGSGKWHVNYPGPVERGFDEYYGFLEDYGVDSWEPKWMKRYPLGRQERVYKEGEFFATNAITDYALDFLKIGRQEPEKPWFLYLAFQAPHFPLQAPSKDIEKYKDTYKVGWDSIRAARLAQMLQLGVIEPETNLSPRSQFVLPQVAKRNNIPGDGKHNPPWNILDADRKEDLARRMAVYAAMVDNLDQNVGRVIKDLENNNELDNTLILFMSDNGACGEWDAYGFEYPDNNARVTGGTPQHPNVLHKGEDLEKLGGPDGPLFSYGSGWANVGNTPFSLYKQFVHEGGISSPLIIHWPKKIKNNQLFKDRYAHVVDVMATCIDVSEANYPQVYNGNEILPMEGISLFTTLEKKSDPERILTFEHSQHPAIRIGEWKLVSKEAVFTKDDLKKSAEFELYNITSDRSETKNLADKYPERVNRMKEIMLNELKRTQVLPRFK